MTRPAGPWQAPALRRPQVLVLLIGHVPPAERTQGANASEAARLAASPREYEVHGQLARHRC